MVSSRLRNIIVFFALCGLMATAAFAGNLTPANPTQYAWELAKPTVGLVGGTVFSFPNQVYTLGVNRLADQSFVIYFTLDKGTFKEAPTLTSGDAGMLTALRSGGIGSSAVSFDVTVNAAVNAGATLTLGNIKYVFPASAGLGYAVGITVRVADHMGDFDAAGANQSLTRQVAVLAGAASVKTITGGDANAVIDTISAPLVAPLTTFVVANGDTALTATAKLKLYGFEEVAVPFVGNFRVMGTDGVTQYALVAGDKVTITINGDFSNVSSVGLDLNNSGTITASATTDTNEKFAISGNAATLTIDGNRMWTVVEGVNTTGLEYNVYFTKTAATTVTPRSFGFSASIAPAAGNDASRSIGSLAASWFTWTQNGTSMWAPYVNFNAANGTKFRFVNGSSVAINVLYTITLDQAAATATPNAELAALTIPANGTLQVTLTDAPAANTGEIGPLVSAVSGGTQPLRGKVTFVLQGATSNVAGMVLIWNPIGAITLYNMPQNPTW